MPMADGGDNGFHQPLAAVGGRLTFTPVTGPLGEPVRAAWGSLSDGKTAIIEMASASGLNQVPPARRNPMITTTFGTGELVRVALDAGFRKIIIGIGGSATNDGGAGLAQALGVRFRDAAGQELPRGGAAMINLAHIDIASRDPRLAESVITLASDVVNPLCGPRGASAVYGPQKGATPEMVVQLDKALRHYADVIHHDLGLDVADLPGAGAAGGLGAGIMAFLGARVRPGVEVVIEATGLAAQLNGADLVITGEGRIDGQTASGKVPVGVARAAKRHGLPVVAIAGEIGDGYQAVYEQGIDAVFSIAPGPITLEQSAARSVSLTSDLAERVLRWFMAARERGSLLRYT